MERWQNKVALVTGASVGIGAAICRELTKYNIKVIGCARSVDKIKALADECPPGSLYPVKCDLEKEEDIESLFKEIREKFGRLDICINNAGFTSNSSLLVATNQEWKAMLNVNVLALIICTREAIKLMREKNSDDGQIIQINSMAGHRLVPKFAFYSGTKHMVRILTEGVRQELKSVGSHIRVASISPGIVDTQFLYNTHKDDPSKAQQIYSSLECLTGADIAAVVVNILQTPKHVDINDVLVRPVEQET